MVWTVLKRVPLIAGLLLVGFIVSSCTMLGLNYASLETDNKPLPEPSILADSPEAWANQKASIKTAFEDTLYGPWPTGLPISFGQTRVIEGALGALGVLEETPITLGEGEGARTFHLVVAYPSIAKTRALPVVIGQSFSSNCSAFAPAAVTGPDGEFCNRDPMGGGVGTVARYIFGEFIAEVPVEQFFRQGLIYANFYASELVPDSNDEAQDVMTGLISPNGVSPTGALMAWAYGYKAAVDFLETDPRIDRGRVAVTGHSRHGKAALIAGAWDPRIDAVIAIQSGYGGAASSRSTTGEGIKRMITGFRLTPLGPRSPGYPHWFEPGLIDYVNRLEDLPVDQHQLLALIAPRPVLLMNGRRDVWSDPNSTYRMAEGADPIYQLLGSAGLDQSGMRDFNPQADLSYFLRPGGHGVDQRDMNAILDFLGAHFGKSGLPSVNTSLTADH